MPEHNDQPPQKIYNDPLSVAKRTKQRLHYVESHDKASMLAHIVNSIDLRQTVVITKTKRDADSLAVYLKGRDITAYAVHGNKRAQDIESAVKAFREVRSAVLITTDMVLQSLELNDIDLMISHDLPMEPKHYLDRLACLSSAGEAIALVSLDEERELFDIERIMRQEIPQEGLEGFVPTPATIASATRSKGQKKKPRHRKQRNKKGKKGSEG